MTGFDTTLHPHTVIVVGETVGPPDRDGVPTITRVETPWEGVNAQQTQTTEERGGREVVVTRVRFSGPTNPAVQYGGQIEFAGRTYEVEGDPVTYSGGALDHTEATGIAWRGV